MLTNRNELPAPEAVARPDFEEYVARFKAVYVGLVRAEDPELAASVEKVLDNEGELLTKMAETFTIMLTNEVQRRNQQVLAVLPGFSKGADLDNVVSNHGIKRQVLDEGDPAAFPPVPPVKESDDDLLLRYWLAPHAPAAGSRLFYKFQCLTLDAKPRITLDKPAPNQVRLTYTFNEGGQAARIRDGDGVRRAIGTGEIDVPVLSRDGDGTPDSELLDAVRLHFGRDDTGVETDVVSVIPAEIVSYQQHVRVWIGNGPDAGISQAEFEERLQAYADESHRLGAVVEPGYISHLMYGAGGKRVEVVEPATSVECTRLQAPHCSGITVEVLTL
ncbi:baseplate J/gp47 family protein [Marinobacterium jannaschii]|uniref:baseplate J/gp47 family protein n=1 Tax=Marinobacterium jannaschii TaxID=64970 RepID=UPI000684A88B|nr:baseplate J/gp47 family protein [Marinobacterium jannaschii]